MQRFHGAGWQTDRFLEGMRTTTNWFCREPVQVCADTWHESRVVLLGDTAYCLSPFSGMEMTADLVGAYVLAGETNRSTEDPAQAFEKYGKTFRPFMNEVQQVKPTTLRLGVPETS